MSFERAFRIVVGEEGGYVNDPRDPGGETKYGISKRSYPNVDIKNLTLEQARAIYREDYWDALKLDGQPWHKALCLFDCAVNQGRAVAVELLQQDAPWVVNFQAERVRRYASLKSWPVYGRGWTRRAIRIAIEASRDDQ